MGIRSTMSGLALVAIVLTGCGTGVSNGVKPAADVLNATQRTANSAVGSKTNQAHVYQANKIADALVKKGYAKSAYVFVVGETAYVAMNQKENISMVNKTKISSLVRHLDPRLKKVSISASPDAYKRFKGFSDELSAGKPVQGVWNNLKIAIEQMFPTTHS